MTRIEQITEFLKENPEDPFLKFAMAQEYIKAEEFEKALASLETLTQENPDYVASYYHLGKVMEKLGRTDSVSDIYTQGIKIATSQGDMHAASELQHALEDFQKSSNAG